MAASVILRDLSLISELPNSRKAVRTVITRVVSCRVEVSATVFLFQQISLGSLELLDFAFIIASLIYLSFFLCE